MDTDRAHDLFDLQVELIGLAEYLCDDLELSEVQPVTNFLCAGHELVDDEPTMPRPDMPAQKFYRIVRQCIRTIGSRLRFDLTAACHVCDGL